MSSEEAVTQARSDLFLDCASDVLADQSAAASLAAVALRRKSADDITTLVVRVIDR